MRLRHKQPLNPYKGQTNNDKNEFNDDDFNQQPSLKNNTLPNTDQIAKYARILTKFIRTVNRDAVEFQQQHPQPKPPTSSPLPSLRPDSEIQRLRDLHFEEKEQNQQQKQHHKMQQKVEPKKQLKQTKNTPKKKHNLFNTQVHRQNKNMVQENTVAQITPIKQTNTPKIVENAQKSNLQPQTVKAEAAKVNNANSALGNFEAQNLPSASSLEANMRLNYQNNIAALLGMQGIMPGMITNHNQSMLNLNGLSQIELAQLLIRFNPQYMYNTLPNITEMPLGMGANGQQIMSAPPVRAPVRPIQNLFSEQVKSFKLPAIDNEASNIKKAYPLKRSAFHVAIAYKIYLDKLKKEGETFQNLQDIDPTRNARRIKTNQQSSKNSKDSLRKKK